MINGQAEAKKQSHPERVEKETQSNKRVMGQRNPRNIVGIPLYSPILNQGDTLPTYIRVGCCDTC